MDGGGGESGALILNSAHVRLVQFGPLVVAEFIELLSPAEVDAALALFDGVERAWGEISLLITYDSNEMHRVSNLTRERARALLSSFAGFTRCAAIAPIGTGLGATCYRAQLQKNNGFTHLGARQRVFGAVAPAMEWISAFEGQVTSVRELSALTVQAMLRALPARPSSTAPAPGAWSGSPA